MSVEVGLVREQNAIDQRARADRHEGERRAAKWFGGRPAVGTTGPGDGGAAIEAPAREAAPADSTRRWCMAADRPVGGRLSGPLTVGDPRRHDLG